MKNLLFKWKLNIKQIRKLTTTAIENHERRVCIVGGGPAGFYAAQYICRHLPQSRVDIIEKLPVPFGLVRFGVAPDHPEVKNVINTFTKTAEHPNVRFLGNFSLGTDISLQKLREQYHAVILAYGAEIDRKLNIPNENQVNILSAREFVAWYNGFPGTENLNPDLSGTTVAVIGQGNVAIDVSRILLSPIDQLKKTDITAYSLECLARSNVQRVYLIGRRGPLQAAFTIKELREMTKLSGVCVKWKSDDFNGIAGQVPTLPRARKRLTELMLNSLEQSENLRSNNDCREFLPIFFRSPKAFENPARLQLTINRLSETNSAVATDQLETIDSDLILRSIGYKGTSVDKDLNFNEQQGIVRNDKGRVLAKSPNIDANHKHENGLYVCGWLATGPTGVIITTMNNSFSIADAVCQDFLTGTIDTSVSKSGINLKDFPNIVTWDGWKKINKIEMEAGQSLKPREKIIDIRKMLNIALG